MNAPLAPTEAYPQRWSAFLILLAGGFMNVMDISVVNVALPQLQAAFNATSSQIEWVAAAYVLTFALGLLPLGRLGDRIGRKKMFLWGIAAFTFFSLACGMAPSMAALIGFRALQGLASAMIMPQILASVQVIFPPAERLNAFSFFGLSAGLASIAGPVLGGLLIGANLFDLGWRWIFLINVPVGVAVIIWGLRLIPAIPGHPDVRNDWGGIVIAAAAVFCLSFPMVEGHSLGWPAWTFVMMAAAAPLALVFVAYEKRRERAGLSQLLPLSLLSGSNFAIGTVMIMLVFAGAMGGFLPITLFLQQGFGFSALKAGLTTAPFAVGVLVGSQVLRLMGPRWVRQRVMFGALAYSGGMLALRHILGGIGDTIHPLTIAGPMFLSGIGMNLCIATIMRTALADVPARDAGSGSGALQTFQNLGSAFGIALAGQIFFATLKTGFSAGAAHHPAYVTAIEAALLFNIGSFLAVAVLALLVRTPPAEPGRQERAAQQPVVVEV